MSSAAQRLPSGPRTGGGAFVIALALGAVSFGCSSSAALGAPESSIVVSPAKQVRQGESDIVVSVARAEGGLSDVTHVALGELGVEIEAGGTDTQMRLHVTVPHGAALGPRALTFDSPSGSVSEDDVIDVTPISVAATGADSNLGTTDAPFRSLKQALSVAGAGDTCSLANGTYDAEHGETWAYALPAGLDIVGESTELTVLQAPAHSVAVEVAGPEAFDPAANSSLATLSLVGFDLAVKLVGPAQVSLHEVAIRGGGAGISLEAAGSTVELEAGSVDATGVCVELGGACDGCRLDIVATSLTTAGDIAPAIRVLETSHRSQLSLENVQLAGGAFIADPEAALTIDSSTVLGSGANAGVNFAGATLDVTNSTVRAGSSPYGISLRSGALSLTDVSVEGNNYSVYQTAGKSRLRRATLRGYTSVGLYFASGELDLGTATEAGGNAFLGSGADAFGIYVNTGTAPVTCSNTSFNGVFPPAGTVQASGSDSLVEPGQYVLTPEQKILFFDVPEQR